MSFEYDGMGKKIDEGNGDIYYHGSPVVMELLTKGSSITRNKTLAEAFSHKPSKLEVTSDGQIHHNGLLKGYLYQVDECFSPEEIYIHEACQEEDPWEWVTTRDLKLKLIGITDV